MVTSLKAKRDSATGLSLIRGMMFVEFLVLRVLGILDIQDVVSSTLSLSCGDDC